MKIASRIIAFLAAAWRAEGEPEPACRLCLRPLDASESVFCQPCADEEIRQRIGTLDPDEALGWARSVALRDKDHELAAALQAVLLLHITGGSLAPVVALVRPETRDEAVN